MLQNIQFTMLQTIILWAIPLLFAITAHEAAHGLVANQLGDPTAKLLGRLTLNPVKHIDPVGTVLLPALSVWLGGFIFGWAKPVPITWRNLKHGKRDICLVAAAGPLANLVMAIAWAGICKGGDYLQSQQMMFGVVLEAMGKIGMYVNCLLGVLNLLPLQPLDGGRIVSVLLPPKMAYHFDKIERYGFIILMILLATNLLSYLLNPPINLLLAAINTAFGI